MKLYTRRGDDGRTGLLGRGRRSKDDPRVEAYGSVDELNAQIGVVLLHIAVPATSARLSLIQSDLFVLGSHLSVPASAESGASSKLPPLPAERIGELEEWIDQAEAASPPLRNFILPGGSAGAAELHVARVVCRRAERRVVALASASAVDESVLRYLNRLSDYLFAAARQENALCGRKDVEWSGLR